MYMNNRLNIDVFISSIVTLEHLHTLHLGCLLLVITTVFYRMFYLTFVYMLRAM